MPKKITEEQRNIAKTALIAGKTLEEAGQAAGISKHLPDDLVREGEIVKKEIRAEFEQETAERIKTLAKKMLSIVESGAQVLTEDVIKNQSGAAIATTMGILVDKMQLLTGGATENVQISAGPKSDDFLKKLQAKSRRNVTPLESAKMSDNGADTHITEDIKDGKH